MIVLFVSTADLAGWLVDELNFVVQIVVDYPCGALGALLARFSRAFAHWRMNEEEKVVSFNQN